MNKIIIITISILLACCAIGTAQTPVQTSLNEGKTVSETIKLMDGQWRQIYKVVDDGTIFYDKRYVLNTATNMMQLSIDTMSIHTFEIDGRGRTKYAINWEEASGELTANERELASSWDLKQTDFGIDLYIKNAYYKGCPDIVRRVVNINDRQLILQDLKTGYQYYYKRRS